MGAMQWACDTRAIKDDAMGKLFYMIYVNEI
jgi:hypothetical protein